MQDSLHSWDLGIDSFSLIQSNNARCPFDSLARLFTCGHIEIENSSSHKGGLRNSLSTFNQCVLCFNCPPQVKPWDGWGPELHFGYF